MASPARGCFVTGTGTEVGKTVVAAVIARSLAVRGERVAVFKPAVSGLDEVGETDPELLRRASQSSQTDDEIAPYRYGPPVSPHLGASLAGERIDSARLLEAAATAATAADALVCEGVGGLLVPLTLGYLVRDFARDLGFAVVVAASPSLGTINHSLLTFEAARAVGLVVELAVLTPWSAEPTVIERSNLEALRTLGGVEVVTLPELDLAQPETWPELLPVGLR